MNHVVVEGLGSISSLGRKPQDKAKRLSQGEGLVQAVFDGVPTFRVPGECEPEIEALGSGSGWDRAVCLGVVAAQQAIAAARWSGVCESCSIVMGSSRGATGTYEAQIAKFLREGTVDTRTSPFTTLGCFASAVADSVALAGACFDLSMTCSSGLMGLAQVFPTLTTREGVRVLVGGAEAPLTPFTIAQMKALGIYSTLGGDFPCRPLGILTSSSFVLGEGAAVLALESRALVTQGDVVVAGCGVARDQATSPTGVSSVGSGFQSAMLKALSQAAHYGISQREIDLIIPHAPGTRKGDQAELHALDEVFGGCDGRLYSHKWLIGHTLGASGVLGVELGLLCMSGLRVSAIPYQTQWPAYECGGELPRAVLVNAAGFGGATVSVVLARI